MLQFVDLGAPIAVRIEHAVLAAGMTFSINYDNIRAPFIVDGQALNAADAADRFLEGGWDGIFG